MVAKRRPTIQIHLRLIAGLDDDLIHWVQTLTAQPYGSKSQAIKTVLRRGLEQAPPNPDQPVVDLNGWLPEIRRALAAELDQRQLRPATPSADPAPATEESEAEMLLRQLQESLTLDDDDDEGGAI